MIVTSLRRRTAALGATALLSVGSLLAGAAPASAAGASAPANPSYPQQVIAIVNTMRGQAHCMPLALNATLMSTAQKHSTEMATYHYFSVISHDGIDPGGRMERAGYNWTSKAEYIAKGPRTPADVVNAWLRDPAYRSTILNCRFKDVGVGLAYDVSTPVWTQDIGATQ